MGKRVSDYMENIARVTVTQGISALEAAQIYLREDAPAIIVTDEHGILVGIVTGTDIQREIARDLESSRLREGTIDYIMTSELSTVPENTLMIEAVDKMNRKNLHTLIVARGTLGNLVALGVLTQHGVDRWWLEQYGKQ